MNTIWSLGDDDNDNLDGSAGGIPTLVLVLGAMLGLTSTEEGADEVPCCRGRKWSTG